MPKDNCAENKNKGWCGCLGDCKRVKTSPTYPAHALTPTLIWRSAGSFQLVKYLESIMINLLKYIQTLQHLNRKCQAGYYLPQFEWSEVYDKLVKWVKYRLRSTHFLIQNFELKPNQVSFYFSTRHRVLVLIKKELAHFILLPTWFYILFSWFEKDD
jgi:hypothetical protein